MKTRLMKNWMLLIIKTKQLPIFKIPLIICTNLKIISSFKAHSVTIRDSYRNKVTVTAKTWMYSPNYNLDQTITSLTTIKQIKDTIIIWTISETIFFSNNGQSKMHKGPAGVPTILIPSTSKSFKSKSCKSNSKCKIWLLDKTKMI